MVDTNSNNIILLRVHDILDIYTNNQLYHLQPNLYRHHHFMDTMSRDRLHHYIRMRRMRTDNTATMRRMRTDNTMRLLRYCNAYAGTHHFTLRHIDAVRVYVKRQPLCRGDDDLQRSCRDAEPDRVSQQRGPNCAGWPGHRQCSTDGVDFPGVPGWDFGCSVMSDAHAGVGGIMQSTSSMTDKCGMFRWS